MCKNLCRLRRVCWLILESSPWFSPGPMQALVDSGQKAGMTWANQMPIDRFVLQIEALSTAFAVRGARTPLEIKAVESARDRAAVAALAESCRRQDGPFMQVSATGLAGELASRPGREVHAGWPGPRRRSPAQKRRAPARWGWSRSLRRRRRPADQPAGFRSAGWSCIPRPAAVEWQERSSIMPCTMRGRAERRQSSPTRGPTGPPPSPSGRRWKETGKENGDSHHLSDYTAERRNCRCVAAVWMPYFGMAKSMIKCSKSRLAPVESPSERYAS